MREIAAPEDGNPNDEQLFTNGRKLFDVLSGWPFETWEAEIDGLYDEFGRPGIYYEGKGIENEDSTPGNYAKCGFLSRLYWPGYDPARKDVQDDLPTAHFAARPDVGVIFEPYIDMRVTGVMRGDGDILGPFNTGSFVWTGLKKVLYTPTYDGRESRLYQLEDAELANLNLVIRNALLTQDETHIGDPAELRSTLSSLFDLQNI